MGVGAGVKGAPKGPMGHGVATRAAVEWVGQVGRIGIRALSNATASMTGSLLAQRGAAPSHTTIAPPAPRQLGIATLRTIMHEGLNSDETQHWPEPQARTNAPCHTRTATPPGSPTSVCHWKALPEGRASEHEDENGAAA